MLDTQHKDFSFVYSEASLNLSFVLETATKALDTEFHSKLPKTILPEDYEFIVSVLIPVIRAILVF
jgi:hypothetical protein